MKRIASIGLAVVAITGLCVIGATSAPAAEITGSVEHKLTVTDDGESSHTMSVYGSSVGKNGLGVSGFFLVNEEWAQAYVGPIWTPKPWLSLEAGIGLQQVDGGNSLRYAGAVWLGNDFGSLYYLQERGAKGDDWWSQFKALAKLGPANVGATHERGSGWGPMGEVSVKGTPFAVWAAWFPEPDTKLLGLKFCF